MNAVDIIVLLAIGGSAILGLLRGFVLETLSLMAWVLAIFCIRLFHASVADLLTPFVGTASGAAILALVLVFGLTFGVGKMIAHAIGRRTRQSVLGPVDRVLGGGFGAVKGLIGATLAFLAFSLVYDTLYGSGARRPDWLSDARTFPLLNASGQAISEFLAEQRAKKPVEAD
ncbi:CvpA family protein [Sphingobium sp. Ant17]|jgi:membrane protein required for colicin V production|uniref:CvpA family protein n=1 Tax=Sphingobium sp. Ant17 TaxID=1461752 RepID=UPI000447EBAA|nr:CvpA family protein [Sphingobium sp. Ant17]EXS68609.1 colicin V production protein [Sphingobium sp. Ant17]MDE0945229.1 CvpA family protein [Sphingobium sp.]|tara:strand:+ start:6147 stop:6662 length:516 start_codon:yes stop_codon:yes gene_type:complete